jgi:hypothetical protein
MAFFLVRSEMSARKRTSGCFPVSRKAHTRLRQASVPGQRFYSPALGRWLSRDSIGERGGLNRYEFTLNKLWGDRHHPSIRNRRDSVAHIAGQYEYERN